MTIVLNGTTGITNDGGYTGDGVVFADTTPADTLVTTTGGLVGIGTNSPGAKLDVQSATSTEVRSSSTSAGGVGNYAAFRAVNGGGAAAIFGSGTTAGNYSYTGELANASFVGSFGNNSLQFVTNSVARAAIDTSGNLLVGTTTNPDNNRLQVKRDSAHAAVGVYAGTTGGLLNWYKNDNTYLASVTFSGSTVTYGTGSDYRLKEDVKPISNALDKVAALKPVSFVWKDDGTYGESFIAHELQELYPTAVTGTKDAIDSNGNPRYQGIDTSKLVAVLTAAIQEQQAIILAQESALNALTARVAALEGTQP